MSKQDGFSMIELMVVLCIVSCLGSIAYPAYSSYWLQVKRLEGRLALLKASTLLEGYAMISESGYSGATPETLGLHPTTEHSWYQLSLDTSDVGYYKLSATPLFKDSACTELSCDSRGQYAYKGHGSYSDCWGNY